jgi:hypothetical protein
VDAHEPFRKQHLEDGDRRRATPIDSDNGRAREVRSLTATQRCGFSRALSFVQRLRGFKDIGPQRNCGWATIAMKPKFAGRVCGLR